jgi:hypothetical protein
MLHDLRITCQEGKSLKDLQIGESVSLKFIIREYMKNGKAMY